jgi:phosphoglycerol transferase MdoB-like AlkP superfamily enzyme
MLSVLAIQPNPFSNDLNDFFDFPIRIFLNLLPILICNTVLYMIIGNVLYGAAVTSLLFNLLSYTNLLKLIGRNEPLTFLDMKLWKEAFTAVGNYKLCLSPHLIVFILVIAIVFFLAGRWLKSAQLKKWLRGIIGVASIIMLVLSVQTVYADQDLYNRLSVGIQASPPEVYNCNGITYGFFHSISPDDIEKPTDYSKEEVKQWISDWQEETGGSTDETVVKPNVVFVMCEAFSDLANDEAFAYTEEENPLYDYYLVANSAQAFSGHMVVAAFGGGTANTEFDVLTGIETNMVSSQTVSSFQCVKQNTNTLARIFSSQGYNTFFMHPGYSWFYNRSNVYRYFGIEDQIFDEVFDADDYKGDMISDAAFLEELKNDISVRTDNSDDPLFAYTVTIQNHQVYNSDKYDFDVADTPFNISVTDETMDAISVYMEGIRDSSAMLLELTEYLDNMDEPTILVFFGDHLPALGTGCSSYGELGIDLNTTDPALSMAVHETPYVIWVNQSYYDMIDFDAVVESLDLPQENRISDIYLGSIVNEMIGLEGDDPYLDFLSEARRVLPAIHSGNYYLSDGTYTTDLNEEQAEIIEKFHKWKYYHLKDEVVTND